MKKEDIYKKKNPQKGNGGFLGGESRRGKGLSLPHKKHLGIRSCAREAMTRRDEKFDSKIAWS